MWHLPCQVGRSGRQRGLIFEQAQLIKELKLLQEHLVQLDTEICRIVEQSREGKILMSMQIIGPIQTAMIIAAIGTIANFERASELKSYFGWAPIVSQTGKPLTEQVSPEQGPAR